MKKINFKQPKYIFPLVILLPLVYLAYNISSFFTEDEDPSVHNELQLELPDANVSELKDKYASMNERYAKEDYDLYTAMSGLEIDEQKLDSIESAYTEEEKALLEKKKAEEAEQQKQMQELQNQLARSRNNVSGNVNNRQSQYGMNDEDREMAEYVKHVKQIQEQQAERQRMLAEALGINKETKEEHKPTEPVAKAEPPILVLKSRDENSDRFNTIGDSYEHAEQTLIRAMIDKTTKAHQGTRLRFKLLDDITIKDVSLKKGSYLYGTVTGFGQQRVKATITSIMVGNKFLKVDLSVFDNDGMEGFYVPESAFRDFMKNAGAQVASQSLTLNSGGYGSELSGEAIALQGLQNIYNSASQAISANIRKNRAKIKYNTIVYLVNSRDSQ